MLLLGRQWYVALGHLRHFQAVCTPALPLYEPRWYTVSKPRLLRSISIMLFGVAISDVCKFTLYNKRLTCVRGPCGPVGTAEDAEGLSRMRSRGRSVSKPRFKVAVCL